MRSDSRVFKFGVLFVISMMWIPAAVARGDIKVRRVRLTKVVSPEIKLPEKVKNIGLVSFEAHDDVRKVLPPAADIFKAVLEETLLRRAPKFAYVDRAALAHILKENPNAKLKPVHMLIKGRLLRLEALTIEGGKKLNVRFDVEMEAILMEDGKIVFKKKVTDESQVAVKEGEALGSARRSAYQLAFRTLAEQVAVMLAGESRSEESLLLEGGPITAAAIEHASKGELNEAQALFKKASETTAERNSGFFGRYVLCRFLGKTKEAQAFLKKAGE